MKSKSYASLQKYLRWAVKIIFRLNWCGEENEPDASEGPYIIVSNHISNVDPVLLCAATDKQQPHYMAKKELFKVPLMGSLVKKLGAFPIDRGGADVKAIRHAVNLLKEGKCVGIFQQGHRYPKVDPRETPIKNGAAMLATKTGAQFLPCFIRTKKRKIIPFITKTEVIIGKPIKLSELNYNPEDKGEYTRISNYVFEKICELEAVEMPKK